MLLPAQCPFSFFWKVHPDFPWGHYPPPSLSPCGLGRSDQAPSRPRLQSWAHDSGLANQSTTPLGHSHLFRDGHTTHTRPMRAFLETAAGPIRREAHLSSGVVKLGESKPGAPGGHLVTSWENCPESEANTCEIELRTVGPWSST